MTTVSLGIKYLSWYVKSSEATCGVPSQKGLWTRSTYATRNRELDVVREPITCNLSGSYLFDDGVAVRQILLVFDGWQARATDNAVELSLSLLLNFWVRGDQRRKPLHDGGSLQQRVSNGQAKVLQEDKLFLRRRSGTPKP
ncbi:hypothetical protein MPH_02932 [Macrophomina phaseolina MS6]|uniref:Uncharacterized protein n=1 Tax=Macrophomina phaseolina (strain MS6) TaxID=1126212 RepID=K2RB96_MACPH|nr:hypothetical protein MPH_02932 [Macrophomina phaseolina MS6]